MNTLTLIIKAQTMSELVELVDNRKCSWKQEMFFNFMCEGREVFDETHNCLVRQWENVDWDTSPAQYLVYCLRKLNSYGYRLIEESVLTTATQRFSSTRKQGKLLTFEWFRDLSFPAAA